MFDAKSLLDQFLGPQAAGTAKGWLDQGSQALESALGPDAVTKGRDILNQGLSSLESTAGRVVGEDRVTAAKDFVGENRQGLAVGAVAGGILGLLVGTRTGRAVGGAAVKVGTLAALGGLAYKAWQSYQSGQGVPADAAAPAPAPQPLPAPTPAPTPIGADEQKLAEATLVAMIQAAKADGHVDEAERAAILGRLGNVEAEAQAFLDRELAAPLDLDRVAELAGSAREAVHLYAASLLAIDPDQVSERAYLKALAERLGLDDALVAEITRQVKGA